MKLKGGSEEAEEKAIAEAEEKQESSFIKSSICSYWKGNKVSYYIAQVTSCEIVRSDSLRRSVIYCHNRLLGTDYRLSEKQMYKNYIKL